jgi:hypothetical protein
VFSVTVFTARLDNVLQQRTFLCSRANILAGWWPSHTNLIHVTLRQTVSRSVCFGVKPHWGQDKMFVTVRQLRFADVGHPLCREDGFVVYNCCWPSRAQSFCLGTNRTENTASNSSSIVASVSAAAITYPLLSPCLSTAALAKPLPSNGCLCWLPNSGFQEAYHSIKMNLTKLGGGGMDWIHLAQDSGQWQAPVNTVMRFRIP